MSVHGVIYGLHDPRTGELRYVGQTTTTPQQRLASHLVPSSLKKRAYLASWLKSLLKAGCLPEIRVLDTAQDQAELDALEVAYIAWGRLVGVRLVNQSEGGGGRFGYVPSPEERAKISAAQKGKPRAPWSPERREKQSRLMAGRCTNSPEHMARLQALRVGTKHTEETRKKCGAVNKGRKLTPEHREKLMQAAAQVPQDQRNRRKGTSHPAYRGDIPTEAILAMLAEGQTKASIARHFGQSPTFIQRRLNAVEREKV